MEKSGKRNKTIELGYVFVIYVCISLFMPMYELRRSRVLFSLLGDSHVSTWERVKFEFTQSHRVFFFSLICARLFVARILAFLLVKTIKLASWSNVSVELKRVLCLIPKVSGGCGGAIRKRRTKIRRVKTRSSTRLAQAAAECRDVIEQRVLSSEKAAFFAKLALFPIVPDSSSKSSTSSSTEKHEAKKIASVSVGLQKYFTLYLNRKFAR